MNTSFYNCSPVIIRNLYSRVKSLMLNTLNFEDDLKILWNFPVTSKVINYSITEHFQHYNHYISMFLKNFYSTSDFWAYIWIWKGFCNEDFTLARPEKDMLLECLVNIYENPRGNFFRIKVSLWDRYPHSRLCHDRRQPVLFTVSRKFKMSAYKETMQSCLASAIIDTKVEK